jgi:hypothetical protein
MEELSWSDRVRNELLQKVKEETNFLHTIKRRKATGLVTSCVRNWLAKHVIGGKTEERIEVTGRR